jgi:hypothetical protein
LRASMMKSADAAPWECDERKDPRSELEDRGSASKTLRPKSLGFFSKG